MIKKTILLLFSLIITTSSFSQIDYGATQAYEKSLIKYYTKNIGYNQFNKVESKKIGLEQLKKIDGSPYANNQFIPSKLYKGDSLIATHVPMRYNIFSDQIELKDPKAETPTPKAALLRNTDLTVQIYDNKYRYSEDFVSEKGVPGSYFEVVWEDGEYSLYKKMEVTYHPPFKAKTSFDNDRPAEFIQNEIYYLVKNKGEFTELPSRKSALYKVLGDKKKEVKNYIKKNDLDIDQEKDLARLVAYYNSLL